MNAWLMRLSAAVFLGLLGWSAPAIAQDEFEIRTVDLGNGLHAIYGRGGAMMVSVGEDGVLVIDDQFAMISDDLLETIAGLSDEPVRFVINTHWHGDHTGGNENFAAVGAIVVAHENVRVRMSAEQFNEIMDRRTPPSPEAALPVITFTDEVTFHWNGLTAEVLHFPTAHTDGDAVIWFPEANVMHMGDIFWNGIYPFLDVSSGGHIDGYIDAMNWAIETSDENTMIIAGHGDAGGIEDAAVFRDMLVEARDSIQALIDEGHGLDEIVAADPLAAYNEEWGGWFLNGEQFIGLVFLSLTTS